VDKRKNPVSRLVHVYPERVEEEKLAFFSIGDKEVQTKLAATDREIAVGELILYLKVLTLLYDRVLHSASFYFESELSRVVYKQTLPLFSEADNLFAVSHSTEDFYAHLDKKRRVTPDLLESYRSSGADKYAADLQALGIVFKRRPDIGDIIASLWKEDLHKTEDTNSLTSILGRAFVAQVDRKKYDHLLLSIVEGRGEIELVPEYISERLVQGGFPIGLLLAVYDRLLDFYIEASAQAMGAIPMDIAELVNWDVKYPVLNRYNVSLFLAFAQILGIKDALCKMSSRQVVTLKRSPEFRNFRSNYFSLINDVKRKEASLRKLRWHILRERAASSYLKFDNFITMISGTILLECVRRCIGMLPSWITFSTPLIPTLLDGLLKKFAQLERTPFLDFKWLVLEQYESEMKRIIGY